MKKEINYVGTALAINVAQLILCFILYIVGSVLNLNNFFLAAIILAVELFIWFVCGTRFAVGKNDITKQREILFEIIYALSPIIIFTVVTLIISLLSGENTGWNHFFFMGTPLIFYNRPAMLISKFIAGNAYIVFFINYALLAITMFLGGQFGLVLKKAGEKRRKKRRDKEAKAQGPIEVVLEEAIEEDPEVEEVISEEESIEEIIEDIDDEEDIVPGVIAGKIDHKKIMEETVEITRESELNEIDVEKFIHETKESIESTKGTIDASDEVMTQEEPAREILKKPTRQRPMPKRKRERRRPPVASAAAEPGQEEENTPQPVSEAELVNAKQEETKKKDGEEFDGKQVRIEDFINND